MIHPEHFFGKGLVWFEHFWWESTSLVMVPFESQYSLVIEHSCENSLFVIGKSSKIIYLCGSCSMSMRNRQKVKHRNFKAWLVWTVLNHTSMIHWTIFSNSEGFCTVLLATVNWLWHKERITKIIGWTKSDNVILTKYDPKSVQSPKTPNRSETLGQPHPSHHLTSVPLALSRIWAVVACWLHCMSLYYWVEGYHNPLLEFQKRQASIQGRQMVLNTIQFGLIILPTTWAWPVQMGFHIYIH